MGTCVLGLLPPIRGVAEGIFPNRSYACQWLKIPASTCCSRNRPLTRTALPPFSRPSARPLCPHNGKGSIDEPVAENARKVFCTCLNWRVEKQKRQVENQWRRKPKNVAEKEKTVIPGLITLMSHILVLYFILIE